VIRNGPWRRKTRDEQKAVGWCGQSSTPTGDGRITRPWNVLPCGAVSQLYLSETSGDISADDR
jgi:hypothetical protein